MTTQQTAMTGEELKAIRTAAGMSRDEMEKALGVTIGYVGRMERGEKPIEHRTELAVRYIILMRETDQPSHRGKGLHLSSPRPEQAPISTDPMERMIEMALIDAGIPFATDYGGQVENRLDFHLPDLDLYIEVKRFHTHRVADQIARAPNVILAQGETAVRTLAQMIRSGGLTKQT